MSSQWQIFTDGGSRGNPGQAACAFVVLQDGKEVFSQSRALGLMTNNEAEYHGLLDSIRHVLKQQDLHKSVSSCSWFLDSKLVVEQSLGRWKVKEPRLRPLVVEVQGLLSQLALPFSIIHVYREQNARADQLLNECLDSI